MVVQLFEQPKSSSVDQPNVSKVAPIEETLGIETSTDSLLVPKIGWLTCFSRIYDWTDELGQYVTRFIAYLAFKIRHLFYPNQLIIYDEAALSPASKAQLQVAGRKTLVLDLDETLVHSCYFDPETNNLIGCNLMPETAIPDYVINIPIVADIQPIEFQIFKRPYVDEFLSFVGRWYEVVIFTASMEAYASIVVDKLDDGRGIFQRRFYRQHCVSTSSFVSKNLFGVNKDLASVFIIDNSPSAYRDFPENAIPIKSYIYDLNDQELLNLLPFLDALRFTKDVRSILGRRQLPAPS
ncbi:CTD nuclear envelope phosphatase 1 [Drosophila grimshawi]|uniref:GH21358 n=1 Tax=Drosophila grimshawi TaxID=7222 RepID=B4J8M2_DROGR|nr:CTD nuclear envelope phosphatase 1 [Drosophila grimshawi]EDW01289.1 GH21358 [Drosophila grimshawi]